LAVGGKAVDWVNALSNGTSWPMAIGAINQIERRIKHNVCEMAVKPKIKHLPDIESEKIRIEIRLGVVHLNKTF